METTLVRALRDAGYRLTGPRRQVAELIGKRRGHFRAAELLDEARSRDLDLGRATVFRALDTFADLGVVERLELQGGEHGYVVCEPEPRHHHHVVCSRCGRVSDVTTCNIGDLARDVARQTGYAVDTHRMELYGVCPACRAAG